MADNGIPSPLSSFEVAELRRVLSGDRFGSYLRAAGGDAAKAIELHAWNTLVSGAFYGPLQMVELALRNAVHDCLSAVYGQQWFRNRQILRENEIRRADDAREQVSRQRRGLTSGRVVAELSFGFWVSLFARRYDALWNAQLNQAFSSAMKRKDLYGKLTELRDLRNRIAHHEPIHGLPLADLHDSILWVLERISPITAVWVSRHSRVPTILGDLEQSPDRF